MWNATVVCTESGLSLIAGNKYEIRNGVLFDSKGKIVGAKCKSLEDLNSRGSCKFEEIVEENKITASNTKEYTLDNLKFGYVVVLRNSMIMMVAATDTNDIIFLGKNDYMEAAHVTNELTNTINSARDIIKIYGRTNCVASILEISTADRPFLWERNEIPYKRMTEKQLKEEMNIIVLKNSEES